MKSIMAVPVLGGLICASCLVSSCEWSGGSDGGFNTSKVDFNANISGQYTGLLAGGKAVANTSGAAITRLLIQQSGNAVEVTDTFGNKYRGTVGAPGAIADFGSVIPSGASVASFQVGWRGTDNTAGREVDFSGVINLITVENVQGDTTTQTTSSNTSNSSDTTRENDASTENTRTQDNTTDNTTSRDNTTDNATGRENSTENANSTSSSGDVGADVSFDNSQSQGMDASQDVNVGSGGTATEVDSNQTSLNSSLTANFANNVSSSTDQNSSVSGSANTANSSAASANTANSSAASANTANSSSVSTSSAQSSQNTADTTRTITSSFSISEENSQLRLQGTWIEQGGLVSPVEARSPATAAILTTTTTGTN